MKIKVFLDQNAKMPTKAHDLDAGFDLYAPSELRVGSRDSATIDTGVHIEIPKGYVGMIKSKSGLNVKHGITCEGVIDAGYTGSIVVKAYNNGYEPYVFAKGDKLTQLVILPIPNVDLVEVNSIEDFGDTERGNGGFGSTGKN